MASTTTIMDFPVEIVAKVFEELDVEGAWAARAVCRYWHQVFDLVAYGSTQSPLTGIHIGVDAACGLTSPAGAIVDRHFVHGELKFDENKKTGRVLGGTGLARWTYEKKSYEYWPGGKWRKYEIGDVLTDIRLQITGLASPVQPVPFRLGPGIGLRGKVFRSGESTDYNQIGEGKFQDFTLLVDTVVEPSPCGKMYFKHSINGLIAPKWQIYALLVHHSRLQRDNIARLRRHYIQSYNNSYNYSMAKNQSTEQVLQQTCAAGEKGWAELPPRWNMVEVEC
jgi:hypothetical protein